MKQNRVISISQVSKRQNGNDNKKNNDYKSDQIKVEIILKQNVIFKQMH